MKSITKSVFVPPPPPPKPQSKLVPALPYRDRTTNRCALVSVERVGEGWMATKLPLVYVSISDNPGPSLNGNTAQYMEASDLREVAALFLELADALDAEAK